MTNSPGSIVVGKTSGMTMASDVTGGGSGTRSIGASPDCPGSH